MKRFSILTALVLFVLCGTGCDSVDANQTPDLSGSWSGVTVFKNGFSTFMTLQQQGSSMSGTMTMSGGPRNAFLTGDVSENGVLTWKVFRDCEEWSGLLQEDAEGQLTGPLRIDRSGCSAGSNSSATVKLTRKQPTP